MISYILYNFTIFTIYQYYKFNYSGIRIQMLKIKWLVYLDLLWNKSKYYSVSKRILHYSCNGKSIQKPNIVIVLGLDKDLLLYLYSSVWENFVLLVDLFYRKLCLIHENIVVMCRLSRDNDSKNRCGTTSMHDIIE